MSTSTSVGVVSAFPLFFTVCYFSPAATRLLSETKKSRHTGKNRPKVKNNASFHGTLHDNELTYVRHRRPAKQNGRQTHKQTVTDRQTHKQTVTDTQTNRQRQTDKQTETDRQTDRGEEAESVSLGEVSNLKKKKIRPVNRNSQYIRATEEKKSDRNTPLSPTHPSHPQPLPTPNPHPLK